MRGDRDRPMPLPERLPAAACGALSPDEFYRRYPADRFVAGLLARRRPLPGLALAWAGGGMLGLVLALAVTQLRPVGEPERAEMPAVAEAQGPGLIGHGIRLKGTQLALPPTPGDGRLHPYLFREGGFVPLPDGATLGANSLLRFSYDSTAEDYLFLFSIDESGLITWYYPEGRASSVPIMRGRNIPLPDGILLDDYVGQERFFALFTTRPLATAEVEAAARLEWYRLQSGRGGLASFTSLPVDCRQSSIMIEKR